MVIKSTGIFPSLKSGPLLAKGIHFPAKAHMPSGVRLRGARPPFQRRADCPPLRGATDPEKPDAGWRIIHPGQASLLIERYCTKTRSLNHLGSGLMQKGTVSPKEVTRLCLPRERSAHR